MTYDETISYLYSQLPMYQRIGSAAYKKDLGNTIALCDIFGNPQEQFIAIHVAGTNGKGSVSNMLASVLMEAGYSTGLYTSPHLSDFRERIRVNGKMCSREFVVEFVEKIKPHINAIQPSFFELTVVMAFEYFKQCDVDIAVVEVGLGGRLDSTNVIQPVLSIITNISFDHMHMLGNTLKEIAFEKAGIIKPNVPVVVGEFHPETFPVFQKKAQELGSAIYLAEENISIDIIQHHIEQFEVNVSWLNQLLYPELRIGLLGEYQVQNVSTVIQSIEVLRDNKIEIPEDAVYDGIANVQSNTGFSGRFQVLSKNPLIICDCAHNSAGLNKLFNQVSRIKFNALHVVTGAVNDKDITASLRELPPDARYYFSKPAIQRGLDPHELKKQAALLNRQGNAYDSVAEALTAARERIRDDDLLLICGSIFVAAEALEYFKELNST